MARVPISDNLITKGRPGDLRLGEEVKRWAPQEESEFVLLGCPDDEGVRLNRGRPGAKDGPNSIRKHLFKMVYPHSWKECRLSDAGNIVPGRDILETHARAKEAAAEIAQSGARLIVLGGGHDFLAPCYMGFLEGLKKSRAGLINIDPHLDVRELENNRPHSGTPFRQVLESKSIQGTDLVQFGYRENRNAKSHIEYCRSHKVKLLSLDEIRKSSSKVEGLFQKQLSALSKRCQTVGVTFDMDACHDTEGTSAAPVLGFSGWEFYRMAQLSAQNPKVRYLEVAEVAPLLDTADRASRIASELIYSFLLG